MSMDQVFRFGYSTKNIPLPSHKEYKLQLVHSIRKFFDNISWRVHFFKNPSDKEEKETFGFKSIRKVPRHDELAPVQDALYALVKDIKFGRYSDTFQSKLKNDLEDIKNETKVIVKGDKTSNYYKLEKEQYHDLLERNIQKEYKKTDENSVKVPVTAHKEIVDNLDLSERVFATQKRQCFVTLKDHKPNFQNNPSCRLLNPCKPEIGRISKKILERVVSSVKRKTELNQWKNTSEVIEWFKKIKNKEKKSFILFDLVSFYPSITEPLLREALEWAATIANISESEKEIIMKCKNSLLYHKGEPWTKKGDKNFDVTMGSYDGAESCDIVGLFILSKLQHLGLYSVGLYRDDGLAVSTKTARQNELLKKKIGELFGSLNLSITIEANKKVVDFLDITMNLQNGIYKPFLKPNNKPEYVNRLSNHPPEIVNNIPIGINRRLANISANREVFEAAIDPYKEELAKSGYKHQLRFEENSNNNSRSRRQRRRRITWFNPPYSKNVETNVGGKFLRIIDELVPVELKQIMNRNTIKISYRCMPNVKNHIDRHNAKLLNQDTNNNEDQRDSCNCQISKKQDCPLPGRCTSKDVVYKSTVERLDDNSEETYTGLATSFKKRHYSHDSNFKHPEQRTATKLSGHIWNLKDMNIPYNITWDIITRAPSFNPTTKVCRLCLTEIYCIMWCPEGATLNKRDELFNYCKHRWKHLLAKT